jgi:large subunit ribosomal protein L21
MTIYAVIKTGGKQYKVAPGDVLNVEKLAVAAGATVEIREVYLLANEQGITTGNPTIANARVVAEVVGEGRDKKIVVFKKKRRKGYQKTIGHRQYFTTLRINEIALGSDVHKAKAMIPRDVVRTTIQSTVLEKAPPRTPPPKARTPKSAPTVITPAPIEVAPSKPESQTRSDRNTEVTPNLDKPTAIAKTPTTHTEPPSDFPEPVSIVRESTQPSARPDDAPVHIPVEPTKTEIPAPAVSSTSDTGIVDMPVSDKSFKPSEQQEIRKSEMPTIPLSAEPESRSRSNLRYWVLAALVVALLSGIVMIFLSDLGRQTPEESVPVAVEPQETPVESKPSKAKRAVQDIKIKKPVAGAAPAAPVQPPD